MSIRDRILPIVRSYTPTGGEDILLGRAGEAMCRLEPAGLPDDPLAAAAVELVSLHIRDILSAAPDSAHGVPIRFAMGEAPADIKNPAQGYAISVTPDAVTLTGFGVAGLYHGAVTLRQCLAVSDNVLALPQMRILDWPDMKTRGHFMESRYGSNLMTLDDWKHVIDNMAEMKMNQLVVAVYGCWCVQYDGRVSEYLYVPIKKYPALKTPVVTRYYSPEAGRWLDSEQLPPMFEQDFFGDLIAYGKTRGVTVFPLFNSYGHNTLIPAKFPEVSAKDENGESSLTGFCTSNTKTYELLFDIYDEIIDRYLLPNGIDSFHVGLDEVWDGIAQNADDIFRVRSPWCKCEKCRGLDRTELFISHAIRILTHLRDRGMKNIYMYHDMLIGHGGSERSSISSESCELMMHALRANGLTDVVVIDWWTYSDFEEGLMFKTTRPDLGLRRTVKPWNGYYHWTLLTNPLRNIYLLAKMGDAEGAEGMQSYSAWDESYDRNHACQADYAWNFKGTGTIGQMSDHYAYHHFGAQADKARRAFALLDRITEDRREKLEHGTPVISNYSLMLYTLSYYFYSYVRTGKPYPRIFPGEALQTLAARRADYERALLEIAAMAKQALDLFTELAEDARCSTKLASRYAFEAGHCLCLSEDYLALLDMQDIAVSACPVKLTRIRAMAGERRRARLALMTRLEQTKEPFLMASHMRNQSIFMQFFADLEGYLAVTPPEQVRLDFFDMRYLESEAFRKLR